MSSRQGVIVRPGTKLDIVGIGEKLRRKVVGMDASDLPWILSYGEKLS